MSSTSLKFLIVSLSPPSPRMCQVRTNHPGYQRVFRVKTQGLSTMDKTVKFSIGLPFCSYPSPGHCAKDPSPLYFFVVHDFKDQDLPLPAWPSTLEFKTLSLRPQDMHFAYLVTPTFLWLSFFPIFIYLFYGIECFANLH